MSLAADSGEPTGLTVVSPAEALRTARPLPSEQELVIDGVSAEELEAFERALAER